jgi:hypothetical protein
VRFLLSALVTLFVFGCSGEQSGPFSTPAPSATPVPPQPAVGRVWVVVIQKESGACVTRATVEIVRGYGLGRTVMQSDPCSYWDPDYDAVFNDLLAGEELTLRASAPGYTATEKTVVPTSRGPWLAEAFELSQLR